MELVQIALAICFQVQSARDKILQNLSLPDDVNVKLNANTAIAGYILISAAAFLALSIALVLMQSCTLDKGFDESAFDSESLLGNSKGGRSDKFGALGDELVGSRTATDRYREKHASYYSKYGLGK